MFKVESGSSGSSANNPNLSLNQQNNFDFELSFCDDGTTDDLFDSFSTNNPSNGSSPTEPQGRSSNCDNNNSTTKSEGTSEDSPMLSLENVRIKIEPEDTGTPMLTCGSLDGVRIKVEAGEEALMPVVSELEAQPSPGSTTVNLDSGALSPVHGSISDTIPTHGMTNSSGGVAGNNRKGNT